MKASNLNLSAGFVAMTMCMTLNAQPQYVRLRNDILAESTEGHEINMFKNSTFAIAGKDSFIVKIEDVNGVRPNLLTGGIEEGAQFQGIEYNENPLKVSFRDKDGKERQGIPSLKTSVLRYYIMETDTFLIPEKEFMVVDVNNAVNPLPEPIQFFQYDPTTRTLQYLPQGDKNLEIKIVRGNGTPDIVSNDSKEWDDVDNSEIVRLILSHDDDNYEDKILKVADLSRDSSEDNEEEKGWFKQSWENGKAVWIIAIIFVLLLIGGGIYMFIQTKRKDDDDPWDDEKKPASPSPVKKIDKKDNKNKVASNEQKQIEQHTEELNNKTLGEIHESIRNIESQISAINQGMRGTKDVERMKKDLEDAKRQLGEKNQLIEQQQGQIRKKDLEIATMSSDIKKLEKDLEDANKTPSGVLSIEGVDDFVNKAKAIMDACNEGELSIQKYIEVLPKEDSEKMSFFMRTYIKNIPTEKRNQWNGILSTLSIKGYINDTQTVPYLQHEQDRLGWLKKHFVEELLQSYISPILIMLDEIGNSSYYGISVPCETDSLINKIIKECEQFEATVKYVKTYQEVKDAEIIDEIDPDLPKEIESFTTMKEGMPLFLSQIGIEARGTRSDKTICVIRK